MRTNRLVGALVLALTLGACSPAPEPEPEPTPIKTFTVMAAEVPTTLDPAGSTTGADAMMALSVFRRLMVVHPREASLKPDLARDCLFTSPVVYECELPKDLKFANGNALTASDVQFSIQRAHRLAENQTSASLFDSLLRIETEGDEIIRFTLRWPDREFGYALAAPNASIVDEELYDPDSLRPTESLPEGSGPYRLVTIGDDEYVFERFKEYRGPQPATIPTLRLVVAPDSETAEQAITEGTVDAVWRSLSDSALQRLQVTNPDDEEGEAGFTVVPAEEAAVRMIRLAWNPESTARKNSDLRELVALSLQPDRTLGSLVPAETEGSFQTFPTGGRPEISTDTGKRMRLSLSYSGQAPGMADRARLLRDQIEDGAGISVRIQPDDSKADLLLIDQPATVNTATAWLRLYLDDPLPESKELLGKLLEKLRTTNDPEKRLTILEDIQSQAAKDLTVLPVAQGVQPLVLGEGVSLAAQPYGPGFQLGLWSFRR